MRLRPPRNRRWRGRLAESFRSPAGRSIHHGDCTRNAAEADAGEHLVEQRIIAALAGDLESAEKFGVVHHRTCIEVHAAYLFSRRAFRCTGRPELKSA